MSGVAYPAVRFVKLFWCGLIARPREGASVSPTTTVAVHLGNNAAWSRLEVVELEKGRKM